MATARLAALVATLAALSGCAEGGETQFDAQGFVRAANDHGAGIELGEPLLSTREEFEVYAIELQAPSATGERAPGDHGHAHAGGSLIVAPDVTAAEDELVRCEGAVSLTCYRAANVVVAIQDEADPAGLAGLDGAIRALGSE